MKKSLRSEPPSTMRRTPSSNLRSTVSTGKPSSATSRAAKKSTSATKTHEDTFEKKHEHKKDTFHLDRAEVAQLETFVKTRSQQLDGEIAALREKLRGRTDSLRGTAASALSQTAERARLKVQGRPLNTVELDADAILRENHVAAPKFKVNTLDTIKEATEDRELEREREKLQGTARLDDENKQMLINFLAKLRLKMEDARFSGEELRDLLLPPDLVVNGEYLVPIEEVTIILQSDLVFPVTKSDQMLMLREYGNKKREIDVRMMLADAGILEDDHGHSRSPSPMGRTTDSTRALQMSGRPPRPSSSSSRWKTDGERDILQETASTLQELQALHDIVLDEDDDVAAKEGEDLHMRLLTGRNAKRRQESSEEENKRIAPIAPANESSPERKESSLFPNPSPVVSSVSAEAKKSTDAAEDLLVHDSELVRRLAEENSKLKKEMSQFDSAFFEELEDLKFRYAKLQDYVGEDPLSEGHQLLQDPRVRRSLSLTAPVGQQREDTSAEAEKESLLPLNKLGWSVRDSLRAMDRANYYSPLVEGPRVAHALTYAPGAMSERDKGRDRESLFQTMPIGGAIPASRSLRRDYDDYGDYRSEYTGDSSANPLYRTNTSALLQSTVVERKNGERERVIVDGGQHGIGAGKYAHSLSDDPSGDSLASLCERRLAFELTSHPKPTSVINALVHKVMDFGEQNNLKSGAAPTARTFITVSQLASVFSALSLSLSPQEIEVLAAGFASNGEGGIDCKEFCEMVHSLCYNLVGSHAGELRETGSLRHTAAAPPSSSFAKRDLKEEPERESRPILSEEERLAESEGRNMEFKKLMRELAEGIVNFDKKAVIGTSSNIFQTLLKLFVEIDVQGAGFVSFADFSLALKDLGAFFSHSETATLARPFALSPQRYFPPSAYPSSGLNHLESFRERELTGSLSGRHKTRPLFGDFLATHGIDDAAHTQTHTEMDFPIEEDTRVQYAGFVKELSESIESLLDQRGGLALQPRLPWVLREFALVDVLLSQLEAMTPLHRRKTLISLQYAFENADSKKAGELDGFAILTALLNSGFRLQRYERVQLLKAAEEFGGVLDYARLSLTLLQTCVDWTQSEREIVKKILSAMGLSLSERRVWLGKLKRELVSRTVEKERKVKAKAAANNTATRGKISFIYPEEDLNKFSEKATTTASATNALAFEGERETARARDSEAERELLVPPAMFLHVLRDLSVSLTPEQEATLLDCLDTEREARRQARALSRQMRRERERDRSTMSRSHTLTSLWGERESERQRDRDFSMPLVDFQAFLSFCARHCGSWTDSNPALYRALVQSIESAQFPLQGLQELLAMLRSFDERETERVSYRAFLICCHRSRLLAKMSEAELKELADTLAIDGAGEIEYKSLALQIRGIVASLSMYSVSDSSLTIVKQLIHNATAEGERQTLAPLRNWLVRETDLQSLSLSMREFNALLREFSVMYRQQDLELLFMEIGREIDIDKERERSGRETALETAMQREMRTERGRTVRVIDTEKLMRLLMRSRAPWIARNPSLARSLWAALSTMREGEEQARALSSQHRKVSLESLLLDKVLSRIEAFAVDAIEEGKESERQGSIMATASNIDSNGQRSEQRGFLIDKFVFDFLMRAMGISLTPEELQFLADASDPLPESQRVNPFLLLDLLSLSEHETRNRGGAEAETLSPAALNAVTQLQTQLWRVWQSARRSEDEWRSDVYTLFAGFDRRSQGLVCFEDLLLCLSLLNVRISHDVLLDIPFISRGYTGRERESYVQYKPLLALVLAPLDDREKEINSDTAPASLTNALTGEAGREKENTLRVTAKSLSASQAPPESVKTLLRLVRRRMQQFIVRERDTEEAWLQMLRVFERFDERGRESVSARDFVLAVSVLLEDDGVVFSQREWEEVIEFFADKGERDGHRRTSTQREKEKDEVRVNYMFFCEMALDPAEVQQRERERERQGQGQGARAGGSQISREKLLDRSKRVLSTDTPRTLRERAQEREREKQQASAFDAEIVGAAKPIGRSPSMATRQQQRPQKQQDPIVERFQQANEKIERARRLGRSYGERETEKETERAARTVGQSSRDRARSRSPTRVHSQSLSQSITQSERKARPLSASSATLRSALSQSQPAQRHSQTDRLNQSRVRFNWTAPEQ